ncbi:MAG: glycosyltransferase family 2 protein [Chloroflexota bacterium]
MTPVVSIVVPAFNSANHLAETLNSVLGQTEPRWELVVVDDGSTDDTGLLAEHYARRDARIRTIRQSNGGVSIARMTGLAATNHVSPYVSFLDADDVWDTRTLDTLIAVLEVSPDAVGAHGLAQFIDSHGRLIDIGCAEAYGRDRHAVVDSRVLAWPTDRPTTFGVLAFRNYIFTSGQVLIRRHQLEVSGGYKPSIRMAEDWDLWLRLTSRGHLAFVDAVVLGYRRHEAAVSNDYRAMARGAMDVRRNLMTSAQLTEEQRQLARTAYRLERLDSSSHSRAFARACVARGDLWSALNHARRAFFASIDAAPARP